MPLSRPSAPKDNRVFLEITSLDDLVLYYTSTTCMNFHEFRHRLQDHLHPLEQCEARALAIECECTDHAAGLMTEDQLKQTILLRLGL